MTQAVDFMNIALVIAFVVIALGAGAVDGTSYYRANHR